MLPTFLILGAAKCGTTSLFEYLGQHPDVFVPDKKEPHFFALQGTTPAFTGPGDERFNRRAVTTRAEYEALFDGATEPARGEASPSSLYFPNAAERIHALLPDARLIVILRDPIQRALSAYLHHLKEDREPAPDFPTAIEQEEAREEAGWHYFWRYVDKGFYHRQLSRYTERFSREQLCVCLLRDLKSDPVATVQRVYRFIGVDDAFVPETTHRHNWTGIPQSQALHDLLFHAGIRHKVRDALPDAVVDAVRTYAPGVPDLLQKWKLNVMYRNLRRPTIPDDVHARLRRLYRDDIDRLEDLIDRDLSHWL